MSKELPYFRWYPSDAQSDLKYRSLTRAARGLFHDALDFSWMNDGLPNNDGAIGRALGMTVQELRSIWPTVRECFPESDDGKLRNHRQEKERKHAKQKSSQAVCAVNSRRDRSSTDVQRTYNGRTTDDLPRAYGSESIVVFDSNKTTSFPLSAEELESAWDQHLKHSREEPKDLAFRVIFGMADFNADRFRERHATYCVSWWGRWQYCPLTFLGWVRAGMPSADTKTPKVNHRPTMAEITGDPDYGD